MRKSLQVDTIVLNINKLYGGIYNVELLQVLMRILTYNTMELWQQVYNSNLKNKQNFLIRILDAQALISEKLP